MKNLKYKMVLVALVIFGSGCSDNFLEEETFSQLSPKGMFQTKKGAQSVLYGAYSRASNLFKDANFRLTEEWVCDQEWNTGGWVNRVYQQLQNFTWDSSTEWVSDWWDPAYGIIRNANSIIDREEELPNDVRELYVAEARFLRVLAYRYLYSMYGPVPLRISNNGPLEMPRSTDEEMQNFIENELLEIVSILPEPGEEEILGRANKGAALSLLCKFYLNTKQWSKCADTAQDIIDLNYYQLFPDYNGLFKVENNGNREMIFVFSSKVSGNWEGCVYINGWFPANFWKEPISGFEYTSNMNNWGAQYRLFDDFYNSFEDNDARQKSIITEYINFNGDTVQLLGNNNSRSFKFWPDSKAIGMDHGNDVPHIRYADILLAKAESLNELNGPNEESIALINQVRNRAELGDITINGFSSKEELRNQILKERGWEFYGEKIRREDLIRHSKLIEYAFNRGAVNAKEYHQLFPIPQSEMNANALMVQNPGY